MTDSNLECQKCILWDLAAKLYGYRSGMCEECFNENFVHYRGFEKEEANVLEEKKSPDLHPG
jgi:hypothetical protein